MTVPQTDAGVPIIEPAEPAMTRAAARNLRDFTRRALVVLALVAVAALVWSLADVLLLLFAGALFAIMLRAPAEWLTGHSRLSIRWSLTLVTVALLALLIGILWLFGKQMTDQIQEFTNALPTSLDKVHEKLKGFPQFQHAFDQARKTDLSKVAGGVLSPVLQVMSFTLGGVVDIGFVLFAGLYLAAEPELYSRGVKSLVPEGRRDRAGQVLSEIRQELTHWTVGQLISMTVVGCFAAVSLSIAGLPGALAIALLTGLLEFMPLVGPLIAAVPALLVGLAAGERQTLWVLGTYLVIHEFESNVLTPLVQRRAASLPPLLSISAMAAAAILLGVPGLILATPIAVACMVAVRMLYVEDVLGGPAA